MHARTNNTPAAAISPRDLPRGLRWISIVEVVVVTGSVLVLIWRVEPFGTPDMDLALRIVIVGSMLASNVLHRDSFTRLGIRFDNLARAARVMLPPTAIAAGVVLALGLMLSSPRLSLERLFLNFGYYILWGFAQQYALQAFILLRLLDGGLTGRAPPAAAALFALVHFPNPGLVVMTFAAGWMWCALFRREPNLLILAVSHACLAVVAEAMLPAAVIGGYHVGPKYLQWANIGLFR
jgi:hypothetical protein